MKDVLFLEKEQRSIHQNPNLQQQNKIKHQRKSKITSGASSTEMYIFASATMEANIICSKSNSNNNKSNGQQ